ncbi:hypothetical protein BH09BAC6_BH09BAC6_06430 [soil metagenome]
MMQMASFGANNTGFGTMLAMVVFVLAAFRPAHTAYFFAQNKVLVPYIGVTLQQPRGLHTNISAIPVEADAFDHSGNIIFEQTGCCTIFAGKGAIQ